ncbi:MAG: TIGR00159 family protein [Chloroflexi bacterium]|nr:TIGR00159 family protein [Chloroflexota bacterium]
MQQLISEILFLGQRFSRKSIIDILVVALIFFVILRFIKDSQANSLLRGLITIFIVISLLYVLLDLPALNWVIGNTLPTIMIIIPILYAPEIRRAFERMGRMESFRELFLTAPPNAEEMTDIIDMVVTATFMLASRNHGALIVMQKFDNLSKFTQTGVLMDTLVTPESLLQIFYPNTPLHDGAVVINNGRILAAACVIPLSSRNVLDKTPSRQMGLRHRAALGMSENNDSITIVVSEESGTVSIASNGKITRGVSKEQLKTYLQGQYSRPPHEPFLQRLFKFITRMNGSTVEKEQSESEDKG